MRGLLLIAALLVPAPAYAVPGAWSVPGKSLTLNSQLFTTASSSPWTVPSGWQSTTNGPLGFANKIECVGGGGSALTTGGGGAAYGAALNVALTGGSSAKFHIGGDNDDSYFCNATTNCSSLAGTAVVAGGQGANGVTPGSAASSIGSITNSGGDAGPTSQNAGGGAGGPNGAGNNFGGANIGGAGDAGLGGAGGNSVAGGDGTEWDGSVGSGGGGGGHAGGLYGGGAGNRNGNAGNGACLVRWYS
jgi:hypothetical protein